jgi:mRNA interferase MazF
VIITRDRAIPYPANLTVALITRTARGLPTEVAVGARHGLSDESVVNCDNLFTLHKNAFGPRRGQLDPEALHQLGNALRIALDLD